jgi:dTDP-glucose 4,6-dehydratase
MFTGGCGAIGAVVINTLAEQHPNTRFVNLDAMTYAANPSAITPRPNYKLYRGSITCADLVNSILEEEQPSILVHLAAETHVDNSFGNSFLFTQTNVFGTHTLLECARNYGKLRLFVHMSTDEVYGSVPDGETCNETSSLIAPSNPYSASKAAAEMFCHAYMKSFKMPIIILRSNNAVSPFQHEEKLIPKIIHCIQSREQIPVHGQGESKRTFIDARDIASAIDMICQNGTAGSVYNIGNDQEYTVLEVIEKVISIMKPSYKEDWVKFVPDRAFQDYRYSVDTSALRALGWSPNISFDDAVVNVINHLQGTKI